MFIIITWNDRLEVHVVGEDAWLFMSHQEAQDFIYNSDNDHYLLSNTEIVELN